MFSHVKTHVLPIPDVEKLPIRSGLLMVTALPKDSKMGCACRIRCWICAVMLLLEPDTKPRYCITSE